MKMFGMASSRERKEKGAHVAVAWSRAIATVLALVTVMSVAAGKQGVAAASRDSAAPAGPMSRTVAASSASSMNVTDICRATPYPSACETVLSPAGSRLGAAKVDPFAVSVRFAMARAATALALARNFSAAASRLGMADCAEVLDITLRHLRDALASGEADADGVTTWLSAAMTHQDTCAESLATAETDAAAHEAVRGRVSALAQFIGTALALHTSKVKAAGTAATTPSDVDETMTALPSWVSEHDRKLLRSSPTSSGVTLDAVVALDGSGTHRSIGEAVAAVTAAAVKGGSGGGGRKVIYVKAGQYEETLTISSSQKNVMLMGDGKGNTVIVGDKSVAGGYTTYSSATVAAMGSGFIAKGLTIVNSAGPGKSQAVALRVGGDLSVVYQCAVQAYQDTLYAYSNRQFYADCDIAGTVDFIFGNAAVVLQGCAIQPRRPLKGQEDTVTAQGRTDPNQNTGIAIHRCRVAAAGDLGGAPVYLGRPWKRYSRTVVMKTYLDGSVAPAGWLEWSGQFALSTLYYGEYGNTGPGAGTSRRVTWRGVHSSMSTSEATRFTVSEFIMGNSWLGGTGVSYISGL